jgi:peptide/nickel transport system permease protein
VNGLWRVLRHDRRAWFGATSVLIVVALAILGPALAPHPPEEFVGKVYSGPGPDIILGTDILGRDVLSRLLAGGQLFLLQGIVAAILGVGAGTLLGVAIGIARNRLGQVVLFASDTVMVIPQVLLVLLILAGFGTGSATLTIAVAIGQVAYTARVVYAATSKVVTEDYYRAARAVGVGGFRLVFGEVLPNIASVVLVEFGVRLSICFVALASLSYLGFGSGEAEWGGMVHDNQGGIALQPLAVLAPVIVLAVFLLGMNMLRDAMAKAMTERSAR